VRYNLPIRSYDLAERIRQEASVLVAPGSALGVEQHLRITVGYEAEKVRAALERIGAVAARI
jgi:aspartate/methionine/tyrosine aminotransferase